MCKLFFMSTSAPCEAFRQLSQQMPLNSVFRAVSDVDSDALKKRVGLSLCSVKISPQDDSDEGTIMAEIARHHGNSFVFFLAPERFSGLMKSFDLPHENGIAGPIDPVALYQRLERPMFVK